MLVEIKKKTHRSDADYGRKSNLEKSGGS